MIFFSIINSIDSHSMIFFLTIINSIDNHSMIFFSNTSIFNVVIIFLLKQNFVSWVWKSQTPRKITLVRTAEFCPNLVELISRTFHGSLWNCGCL